MFNAVWGDHQEGSFFVCGFWGGSPGGLIFLSVLGGSPGRLNLFLAFLGGSPGGFVSGGSGGFGPEGLAL